MIEKILQKRERIFKELRFKTEILKDKVSEVRERCRQLIDSVNICNMEKFGGVDGSYKIESLIVGNVYAFSVVGCGIEKTNPKYYRISDFNFLGTIEEESDLNDDLLKGLCLGCELVLAKSLLDAGCEAVFLDGSVKTYIIKINVAINSAKKYTGVLLDKWERLFPKALETLKEIPERPGYIFIPKRTSSNTLQKTLGLDENLPFSDHYLLPIFLRPNECVHIPEQNYAERGLLHLSGFPSNTDFLLKLSKWKESYFLSPSGRGYKVEYFDVTENPVGKAASLVGMGRETVFPVLLAEKEARNMLRILMTKDHIFLPIRNTGSFGGENV